MSFPALDPATGCRDAGPGATNMLYWLDRESGWREIVYNLGVCNCRMIAGKATRSCHGECRAWDAGLPMVDGRANPIGHEIVRALLPKVGQLGIQCLIFDRTIWSASSPQGKRYTGVSPHYDHIHGEHTRRSASVLNVPTVRSVMGPQSRPTQPPPIWASPRLPVTEENEMYVQSDPKQGGDGTIYAIDILEYEALTPVKWAKRREEGATIWPAHPLVVLHRLMSRTQKPTS